MRRIVQYFLGVFIVTFHMFEWVERWFHGLERCDIHVNLLFSFAYQTDVEDIFCWVDNQRGEIIERLSRRLIFSDCKLYTYYDTILILATCLYRKKELVNILFNLEANESTIVQDWK